jgi:hypothetical protein
MIRKVEKRDRKALSRQGKRLYVRSSCVQVSTGLGADLKESVFAHTQQFSVTSRSPQYLLN